MKPERAQKERNHREKPKKEFDELLLEVRRVTRVTTGGRRMSFRATILVGNRKGKIWLGSAKWNDVAGAVSKATNEAYKALFQVPITRGDTVPYELTYKYKASRVRLLPASEGTWLKAWSSIRSVLELAGYSNILSKMIGSNNKLNNALATILALASYKHADHFSSLRTVKAIDEKADEKIEEKDKTKSAEKKEKTKEDKKPTVKKTAKAEKEVKEEKVVEKVKSKKVEKKEEVKEDKKKSTTKKAVKVEKEDKQEKVVEKKAPVKKATTKKTVAKKTTKKEEK